MAVYTDNCYFPVHGQIYFTVAVSLFVIVTLIVTTTMIVTVTVVGGRKLALVCMWHCGLLFSVPYGQIRMIGAFFRSHPDCHHVTTNTNSSTNHQWRQCVSTL